MYIRILCDNHYEQYLPICKKLTCKTIRVCDDGNMLTSRRTGHIGNGAILLNPLRFASLKFFVVRLVAHESFSFGFSDQCHIQTFGLAPLFLLPIASFLR